MTQILARRGLPPGRVSRAFSATDLKEMDLKIAYANNVYLDIDDQGFIVFVDPKGVNLPPNIITKCKLAGDVQNKNLELCCEDDLINLRVLKDLAPDDGLELWFSEEVLARIDMPFLTPRNITGKKNYVCHECGVQFEQPNPLKIHLFLSCQSFSTQKFWMKFVIKMKEEILPLNLSIDITKNVNLERRKSQENLETVINQNFISRSNSEPPTSAFKPYKINSDFYANFNNNSPFLPNFLSSELAFRPAYNFQRNLVTNEVYRQWQMKNVETVAKSLEHVSVTNPAEIETLATNWGKSKEGHLCLYCGKVYSRKYGLKIHIRTHTGYKPLQCKYCLRPFGDPSNLNKHVRLHSQSETPYSCNLCGKMLVRKRDLERHLRSRHGDDQFTNVSTPSP